MVKNKHGILMVKMVVKPLQNLLKSLVEAYNYNVGNGGGKNLKKIAEDGSVIN